ncbi:MAG: 3-dehydroquinate synthase II [Halobacteriales archaeon]
MDRFLWLRADAAIGPPELRESLIAVAATLGLDGVLVDGTDVARVRSTFPGTVAAFRTGGDGTVLDVAEAEGPPGDVTVVGKGGEGDGTVDRPARRADSGDLAVLRDLDGRTAAYVVIDGEPAADFARWLADVADVLIVKRPDWEVIPLENLIADVGDRVDVVAAVDSAESARTAFETLEVGANGVLLETDDPGVVEATLEAVDELAGERLPLEWATVTSVDGAGLADRVCVDMGSILDDDEGLLVGSHARGLALVHAETAEGPYVDPRPFRVNAGAVHAYVLVTGGETRYLSELRGGDRVLVADAGGATREAVVGRVKIERRPMRRVVLETAAGDAIETLLQDAETVRLRTRTDGSIPVTDLEPGDEVAILNEDVPRHLGTPVAEETLIER